MSPIIAWAYLCYENIPFLMNSNITDNFIIFGSHNVIYPIFLSHKKSFWGIYELFQCVCVITERILRWIKLNLDNGKADFFLLLYFSKVKQGTTFHKGQLVTLPSALGP